MADYRAYTPRGGAAELWKCRDRHVLLDGPRGTGKTRAVVELAHLAASTWPGARILFVRQTRASLTESALVTYERDVLPAESPIRAGAIRRVRQSYKYPNGSTIVCGGLDKVERIRSSEWDMICVFEATETSQDSWEQLDGCLRNGMMPFHQAIADCNPSYPRHWLKVLADEGKLTRILSRHGDNPKVTEEYLASLAKMTGHRRARLYLGQWAAAEGLVYDLWDDALFVKVRDVPWQRLIVALDEGYTNPCSMHLYGVDGDGRVHCVEEWYETQKTYEFVCQKCCHWASVHDIEAFVVPPDAAALRAAMIEAGLPVVTADDEVWGGIQLCQSYLQVAGDGEPRFTVDPKCRNFLDEIMGFRWRENADGTRRDEPLKVNDHAMSDWRYALKYIESSGGSMEVFAI